VRFPEHRQTLEHYPYQLRIEPRFGDVDMFGHINNVSIARYLEEGRVQLRRQSLDDGVGAKPEPLVLASIQIGYLAESYFPDELIVGVAVARVGNSSFALMQAIFQKGRCVVVADSVLVTVEPGKGPKPISGSWRTTLEGLNYRGSQDAAQT